MVQLLPEPISCTSMVSINGESSTKESTLLGMIKCSADRAWQDGRLTRSLLLGFEQS